MKVWLPQEEGQSYYILLEIEGTGKVFSVVATEVLINQVDNQVILFISEEHKARIEELLKENVQPKRRLW